MGQSWVPPGGEPAGRVLPAAGWYRDPEGRGGLRWWDGTAWADVASWPAPAPAPPAPPRRVSAWLASSAASPLLALVAAVTAVGWAGAAVVMVAVAAAARPVLPAMTVDVSVALVLPVADLAVWVGVQACLGGRARLARPPGAARAMRRAARRARRASPGSSVAVPAVRRLVRRRRRPFACLPRPVGWCFAAAVLVTAGACPWVIFEAISHGWGGDVGTTTAGQQLAAMAWMMHLITWSGVACRRLDRTRAAANLTPVVSAGGF